MTWLIHIRGQGALWRSLHDCSSTRLLAWMFARALVGVPLGRASVTARTMQSTRALPWELAKRQLQRCPLDHASSLGTAHPMRKSGQLMTRGDYGSVIYRIIATLLLTGVHSLPGAAPTTNELNGKASAAAMSRNRRVTQRNTSTGPASAHLQPSRAGLGALIFQPAGPDYIMPVATALQTRPA